MREREKKKGNKEREVKEERKRRGKGRKTKGREEKLFQCNPGTIFKISLVWIIDLSVKCKTIIHHKKTQEEHLCNLQSGKHFTVRTLKVHSMKEKI